MNIAYLGQMADISTENGVAKKIRGQAMAWTEFGHRVRYFSLARTATVWPGFSEVETQLVERGSLARRFARSIALARAVRAWAPDVIYFRYAYHSPGLPALFRAVPTIAEVNSDDVREYPRTLPPWAVAYHRLTRSRVLRAVAGLVPVTHELGQRLRGFAKRTAVIANGISLREIAHLPALSATALVRLVFVGTAQTPWHGIDRVAELAVLFPELAVDVIGSNADDWRASTARPLPPNVHLHGALPRLSYEPILAAATAAIGTMALYRNGMDEACTLKLREYLASGLPVIAAHDDTDVPSGADYYLRLPNDATPLTSHRDSIAAWLDAWRGRRVPRSAVSHLDTAVKEKQRLEFIARIAQEARR